MSELSAAQAAAPHGRLVAQAPWQLYAAVLGGALGIALYCMARYGIGTDGLLHMTRYTARLSFLAFVLVFTTGALFTLWPNPATRWLRQRRRHLGLSFALAHFLHLGALIGYFAAIGEVPDTVTLIGGGAAYVFVALLALTSNDAAVRRLGQRNWARLHTVGIAYLWLIFMNSYLGRALGESPPEPRVIFVVTSGLGLLALALRVAAWHRRRKMH